MLRLIKLVHTLVWLFFVTAIVAIPAAAASNHYIWALTLTGVVMIEVLVLALNDLMCPLTGIAAKHTTDRRANFDIYLPLWLATFNKQVFGTLFVAGAMFALVRWVVSG